MTKKDKKAEEYCKLYAPDPVTKLYAASAFKAGWNAALDYFSNLPFDEMLERFEEYLKEEKK